MKTFFCFIVLVLFSNQGFANTVPGFAPDSLPAQSRISYQGTVNETYTGTTDSGDPVSGEDSYFQSAAFTITGPNSFTDGTYTYSRNGANTASISYFVPDSGTETSDEMEDGELSLTFTSPTGGTFTSSGNFAGQEYTDSGIITYSGTFTGSGSFTLTTAILGSDPSGLTRTLAGPLRLDSGTLKITNEGNASISTTISSDREWLTLSPEFSNVRSSSIQVTIAAKSDYNIGWDVDVTGLPLGVLGATITSAGGGLCTPVEIRNLSFFLPKVVNGETGGGIAGAIFHVTRPDNSRFTVTSGPDGFPSPQASVLIGGTYRIAVMAQGYIASEERQATVSSGASQFPVFSLLRPPVSNSPPTLTSIPFQQTASGSSVGPLPFVVSDAETPASNLGVTAVSSNQTLVPDSGITLDGTSSDRSISFSTAAGQWGNSKITVTVSDGISSGSMAFLVSVPRPTTPPQPGNPPAGGFTIGGFDDFDDNSKDPAKWGGDISPGLEGTFTETAQRVEFTCAGTSDRYRPWILSSPGYDKDWEVSVEVSNLAPLTQFFSEAGIGLAVFETSDNTKSVQMELYRYRESSSSSGYYSSLNGGNERDRATGFTYRALRISFDATTKVLTCYQGSGSIPEGYSWTEFAAYGIAGSGGTRGNTNWGMVGTQQFRVALFAYSDAATVTSGTMHTDNFRLAPVVSGGVGGMDNPFQSWLEANSINPGTPEAAPDFDGDLDGSDILVEYAFGTDPKAFDPAPTSAGSGLPGVPNVNLSDPASAAPKLRIEYVRRSPSTNPGIVYAPEFSCSLESSGPEGWLLAAGIEQIFDLGNGWERVVIKDTQETCEGRRFGRVKIIPAP